MTQTVIGIKLTVEGFHRFPSSALYFGDKVDFLSERHRHNFGIICEFKVSHDERDFEFILKKREIQKHIGDLWGTPAEFENRSCESIARSLLEYFDCEMVSVDEDGENYAKIIK